MGKQADVLFDHLVGVRSTRHAPSMGYPDSRGRSSTALVASFASAPAVTLLKHGRFVCGFAARGWKALPRHAASQRLVYCS